MKHGTLGLGTFLKKGMVCALTVGFWGAMSVGSWSVKAQESETSAKATSTAIRLQMIRMLENIHGILTTEYAPLYFKQQHLQLDLDLQLQKGRDFILAKPVLSIQDYWKTVKGLVGATRDYHTDISFISTAASTLPFMVREAEGKLIVVDVQGARLGAGGPQVGDELVSLDGVSAQAIHSELALLAGVDPTPTDRALAARYVTRRFGALGIDTPQGPVTVEFRSPFGGPTRSRQLIWNHQLEQVDYAALLRSDNLLPDEDTSVAPQEKSSEPLSDLVLQVDQPTHKLAQQMKRVRALVETKASRFMNRQTGLLNHAVGDFKASYRLGNRESYLGDLGGRTIWQSAPESAFHAYVYQDEQRRQIGVVRIPHYTPEDAAAAVTEFSQVVAKFNDMADFVVVDQLHNPGGSVFYLYALASYLGNKPLTTPRHRMALSPVEVQGAGELEKEIEVALALMDAMGVSSAGDIGGYPVDYQVLVFIRDYCRFIKSEWSAGRRLTKPNYLYGVDKINPAPGALTKPFVVLVDELDFSGGDFFPAIVQDNKLARIVGSRTSGAGGYVLSTTFNDPLGVYSLSYTGSLAYRPDGKTIENLGVTPDLVHHWTVRDLASGYSDFKAVIQGEIEAALKK